MQEGAPPILFCDRALPMASWSVAKSSLTCTGIFGSTVADECIPPHWQLPTDATDKERQRISTDFLTHFRDTRGKFGYNKEKTWETKIGGMVSLRLFRTIFLHTTSSKRCDNQPHHTRTGKNTATMVAKPPSSPATWS